MGRLIYCYARDFDRHMGGAEIYVQAHCMAAARAGYAPELHSVGPRAETVDAGYARIVRARSRSRQQRLEYAALTGGSLAGSVESALRGRPGPHVLHSFGTWAIPAARATRRLRAAGVEVHHVASCYELLEPHTRSKLDNAMLRERPLAYARQWAVHQYVLRSAAPAEARAMRECDAVIVNYERLRGLIASDYDPAINVVKLPYATVTAFEPAPENPPLPAPVAGLAERSGPLIVCTSRQMPRKGVDVLIRALAGLRDDGVEFHAALVSGGDLLEHHRALVAELGLADRVAMPGWVPDVRPYLAHADAFVLPSLAEGSGSMSVNEALQCRVPVVASGVDGLLEDLTDGVDALLVPPGAVDPLQRALSRLAASPELRGTLAAAGRGLYERRFSADAMSSALGAFYAELGLEATAPAA